MKRYFYKRNRFHQLKGFCAVMKEGSIAKAADIMHLSATSIGLQIQALERELGIVLFKRIKQRLHPTEEALTVYREALQLLEGIDDIYENTASLLKNKIAQSIKIAGHPYALSHLLPKTISETIRENKNVKIKLYNVPRDEAIIMLKAGEIDMLIFPMNEYDESLEVETLYKGHPVLAMHKNHPLAKIEEKDITWEELKKHEIAHIGKAVTVQGLASNIKGHKLQARVNIENGGTWDIGRGLIKENTFVGIFDKGYLNASDKEEVVEKSMLHLSPDYSFQIVTLAIKQNPVVVQFINKLKSHFEK